MNILIDIGHPAHVHMFKNFAWKMKRKGHNILFTARDKEHEIYLLKTYNLEYISFGQHPTSICGKIFGLLKFNILMLKTARKFKAEIFLSHGSIYAAQVSWLLRKPHISLEDTFNFEQIKLYKPFTGCILTGNYLQPTLGDKCINYPGYHELAYLHPDLFTPNEDIRLLLGVGKNERYVIIRFVSWTATHDIGHKGLSINNKKLAVTKFLEFGKVFISSESKLPEDLEQYKINIPPERMHDAISFSSLFFGESATMASEAAVMGVPAIFLDDTGRLYTKDLEDNYGLVYNYSESEEDQKRAIRMAVELLSTIDISKEWKEKQQKMLKSKINVSDFLFWFVSSWPESFKTMKSSKYSFKYK